MTDDHERRPLLGETEKCVQFVHDLTVSARVWTELTPTVAGAIVRANAGEPCHSRLNETPLDGEIADSGFENDRRLSRVFLPCAVEVQTPTTDVNELAPRREWRRVRTHLGPDAGGKGNQHACDPPSTSKALGYLTHGGLRESWAV
jgi:hypothetical protein